MGTIKRPLESMDLRLEEKLGPEKCLRVGSLSKFQVTANLINKN
jgi:hypothetical protein